MLGLAISAAALVVFVNLSAEFLNESDIRNLAVRHWGVILVATLIYCLAYVPMTTAWIGLAGASGASAPHLALTRVLLISQIGKYLPGNVAHFLGRAFLAKAYGVTLSTSGLATVLEIGGILAASGILAALALALGVVEQSETAQTVTWFSGFAGVLALLGSAWVLRNKRSEAKVVLGPLLRAIFLYVVVLLLLALSTIVLVAAIGGDLSPGLAGRVAGAFLVSWLIGFATPGSPAGLGLRELTFVALLADTISQDVLLLTAVAFRVATVIGDLIAWSVGVLLPSPKRDLAIPEPLPL